MSGFIPGTTIGPGMLLVMVLCLSTFGSSFSMNIFFYFGQFTLSKLSKEHRFFSTAAVVRYTSKNLLLFFFFFFFIFFLLFFFSFFLFFFLSFFSFFIFFLLSFFLFFFFLVFCCPDIIVLVDLVLKHQVTYLLFFFFFVVLLFFVFVFLIRVE